MDRVTISVSRFQRFQKSQFHLDHRRRNRMFARQISSQRRLSASGRCEAAEFLGYCLQENGWNHRQNLSQNRCSDLQANCHWQRQGDFYPWSDRQAFGIFRRPFHIESQFDRIEEAARRDRCEYHCRGLWRSAVPLDGKSRQPPRCNSLQ